MWQRTVEELGVTGGQLASAETPRNIHRLPWTHRIPKTRWRVRTSEKAGLDFFTSWVSGCFQEMVWCLKISKTIFNVWIFGALKVTSYSNILSCSIRNFSISNIVYRRRCYWWWKMDPGTILDVFKWSSEQPNLQSLSPPDIEEFIS